MPEIVQVGIARKLVIYTLIIKELQYHFLEWNISPRRDTNYER